MSQALQAVKDRIAIAIVDHSEAYAAQRLRIIKTAGVDISNVDENNNPRPFIRTAPVRSMGESELRPEAAAVAAAHPINIDAVRSILDNQLADVTDPRVDRGGAICPSDVEISDVSPDNEETMRPSDVLEPAATIDYRNPLPKTDMVGFKDDSDVRVTEHGTLNEMFNKRFENFERMGHHHEFDGNWGNPRKGYRGLTKRNRHGEATLFVSTNLAGQRLAVRVEYNVDGSMFTRVMYERNDVLELATAEGTVTVDTPLMIIKFFETPLSQRK